MLELALVHSKLVLELERSSLELVLERNMKELVLERSSLFHMMSHKMSKKECRLLHNLNDNIFSSKCKRLLPQVPEETMPKLLIESVFAFLVSLKKT